MGHLFREDGKTLIVAMDHAGLRDRPLPGLINPGETIRKVVDGGADAILTTFGTANHFAEELAGCGFILTVRYDGLMTEQVVEAAVSIGADGIKCMVYPWRPSYPDSLFHASRLGAECWKRQILFLAEVIPGERDAGPDFRTPERIAAGARVGAEAGADFVKTLYTGSPDTFKMVVENCYVPVVILGGAKMDTDRDLLEVVKGSIDAGGNGVAFGRNIWQHPHPEKIVSAIASIIHDDATVEQALMKLR
jgi:DhnA family fructose-bisphosphate aldolase class Ia